MSREAKKKQHACASSGPRDHYSELFTQMAALKLENAVTQPLQYIVRLLSEITVTEWTKSPNFA